MQIGLAITTQISDVTTFFNDHLDRNNTGVYSEEFLCPLGIKAAIRRKQMIVATVEGQVVGAFRFYRKKTQNIVSLYQFAISERYRGKGLLSMMLRTVNHSPIVTLCPTESDFNEYYYKSGWHLQEQREELNVWIFND